MVIHQPRYSLFTLIDDVLLLGVGGKTVFLGPTSNAMLYFETLGFQCPPTENPSDFFLDVISGQVSLPDNPTFEAKLLPEWWKRHQQVPEYLQLKPREFELSEEKKLTVDVQTARSSEKILIDQDHLGELSVRSQTIASPTTNGSPGAIHQTATFKSQDGFEMAKLRASSNLNSVLPSHVQQVRILFEQLDADKDGVLQRPEIIQLIKSFSKNLPDEDVSRYVDKLELISAHGLTFEDFIHNLQEKARAPSLPNDDSIAKESQGIQGATFLKKRSRVYFGVQLQYFLKRECSKLLGNWMRLVFDLAMLGGFGAFIGIVFGSNYDEATFVLISQFATLAVGLLSCTCSLRWFGAERVNYWREQSAGTSRSAYIIGKMIVQLCEVVFYPLVFAITFFGTIYPRGRFGEIWGALILIYWVGSGMGLLFSCVLDPQKALLLGVLTPLGFGGFVSGINPPFNDMVYLAKLIAGLSFERWGMELFLIVEYQSMEPYLQNLVGIDLFTEGFSPDMMKIDILALVTLGLVFRVMVYPALRFINRSKQV
jgi:hypothetical protein